MGVITFNLKEEFIPLIQLLKFTGVAETGAHASEIVTSGMVQCNGQKETRKRYKVRRGDIIIAEGTTIEIH